jgi:hypothetical protein
MTSDDAEAKADAGGLARQPLIDAIEPPEDLPDGPFLRHITADFDDVARLQDIRRDAPSLELKGRRASTAHRRRVPDASVSSREIKLCGLIR